MHTESGSALSKNWLARRSLASLVHYADARNRAVNTAILS